MAPFPRHPRAALTLMEVLAVVVILSLLAVTLVVALGGRVGAAKHKIAEIQLAKLRESIESYQAITGRWPESLAVLTTPNTGYTLEPALLKDPWGHDWQFVIPGRQGHPYELISLGSDGQTGGEGEAADLSSATVGLATP